MVREEAEKAWAARAEAAKEEKREEREESEQRARVRERRLFLPGREKLKKLRKEARLAERERIAEEKKRAEERALRPTLAINAGGAPLARSYNLFRSQLRQVVRFNFHVIDYWGKIHETKKQHLRDQMKEHFSNGHFLDDKFLNQRIALSLSDRRNHVRENMRNYLKANLDSVEVIKEKGCPDTIPPEAWEAWLDIELQV